jgi:hypothetical protein
MENLGAIERRQPDIRIGSRPVPRILGMSIDEIERDKKAAIGGDSQ